MGWRFNLQMSKKVSKTNFKELTKGSIDLKLDFLEKQEQQVLGDLSISFEKPITNFSFKMLDLDREFIQNPNIVERKSGLALRNKGASLENKFSELGDPIFDLDERPELQIKEKIIPTVNSKNIVNRVKLAKKGLNLDNTKARY